MKLPQPLWTMLSKAVLNTPTRGKPVVSSLLRLIGRPVTARFIDYVIDFEDAYATDEWSTVEGYFTPDAVYEVRNTYFDCHLEGPKAIVQGFQGSLNGFDRQLKRSLRISDGPYEDKDTIHFGWIGEYTAPGHPPLEITARQSARYRDGLIAQLADEYPPGEGQKIADWIEKYDLGLDPNYR